MKFVPQFVASAASPPPPWGRKKFVVEPMVKGGTGSGSWSKFLGYVVSLFLRYTHSDTDFGLEVDQFPSETLRQDCDRVLGGSVH
jgi:hypothetical protein